MRFAWPPAKWLTASGALAPGSPCAASQAWSFGSSSRSSARTSITSLGWATATPSLPEADALAQWLSDHRPASPKATLLHNDWRLDNMALDPADPGRCVAVYDWDMCTLGDPLADLGTLLALWSNRGSAPAGTNPMPTQTEGFLTREEAVTRYGERSGRDVSHVPWYDVFGTFKMAVVLQQIFFRFAKGQTQDARFKGLEHAARGLFTLAASRRP